MTGDKAERRHRRFPDLNDWSDRDFPGLPGRRPMDPVRLPATIPVDEADASYADGILSIRVPMPHTGGGTAHSIPVRRAD